VPAVSRHKGPVGLDRFQRRAPSPECPWCDENPYPPHTAGVGDSFQCDACMGLVRVTDYDYCSIMGPSWGLVAGCPYNRDYCRRGAPCSACTDG